MSVDCVSSLGVGRGENKVQKKSFGALRLNVRKVRISPFFNPGFVGTLLLLSAFFFFRQKGERDCVQTK